MNKPNCASTLNIPPRTNRLLPKIKGMVSILALMVATNNGALLVKNDPATLAADETTQKAQPSAIYNYHPARLIANEEMPLAQTSAANIHHAGAPAPSRAAREATQIAKADIQPSQVESASPMLPPRLETQDWQNWEVIPTMSERMLTVYQAGLAMGNNPRAFTKVGDGEISALWFLTEFDLDPEYYNLGPYPELLPTIEYFAGSFAHISQAARRGFNTTRILDPSLADPNFCDPGESPLNCELRLYRPSFALISLGTNQVWASELLEPELRQIIEILLANNIVPVLSTKADNLEGDHRINAIIAGLAAEYEAPLWNFWRAVQALPDHGLQADMEHLTYAPNNFGDAITMQNAWPVRNLTALQVLTALWEAVR